MRTPPPELAARLGEHAEHVLTTPELRLEDVARTVGVSRAKLYYYFAGLTDLHAYLVEQHLQEGARMIAAAADPALDPPERLHAVISTVTAFLAGRPGLCAGLLGGDGPASAKSGMLAQSDAIVGEPLRALIAEGRGAGTLRAADVAVAADAVVGAVLLAVLGRWRRGADDDVAAFAAEVADQVLTGLAA